MPMLLDQRACAARRRAAEQRDEFAPVHCQFLPCFRTKEYHTSVQQETAALRDFNSPYDWSGVNSGPLSMSAAWPL
jgi:hypothetical protein